MLDTELVLKQGGELFGKRSQLLSLWQNIADNFYPERADFTTVRNLGAEFATNLMSSYPIIARRDLGNSFGSMLRPTSKQWQHIRTKNNWDTLSVSARAWLEDADTRMTRAMYARPSQFTRATKEADHDFAAFGQAVLQISLNSTATGILYKTWHLRDVAWAESPDGNINTVYRKWKATAIALKTLFPNTIHRSTVELAAKNPYTEIEVWHCVMETSAYNGDKKWRTKYVSLYLDVENNHILEEVGVHEFGYVIPRWQTVSGSQYAYSPATVAALPDARLIQAMTRVLLEAGEKATTPPMIAVQEAIRSDISVYAGGITWVDSAYDERLGEVLRPITQDLRGIPNGMEMAKSVHAMIAEAFFLNKLALPQPGNDMTAYEVGQRVQEYIRQAMPLFEPMENEYNAPLCETTFSIMLRSGGFGSVFDIPRELQGQGFEFEFESPLHDAVEREKGQRFLEAQSMLAQAVQLDPSAAYLVDVGIALRDVLNGIGVPAKWTRSQSDMDKAQAQAAQKQQTAELLANMQTGANINKTLADAQTAGTIRRTNINDNATPASSI